MATLSAAANLLLSAHRSRPEAAEGLWIAAMTYQEVGLFSEAANYHATIAEQFPKFEHHRDAAFNAVLLRVTVGEHDKAIQSGEQFRRAYPRDDSADEVVFLMGKAHEKAGKKAEAAQLYEALWGSSSDEYVLLHSNLKTRNVELLARFELAVRSFILVST